MEKQATRHERSTSQTTDSRRCAEAPGALRLASHPERTWKPNTSGGVVRQSPLPSRLLRSLVRERPRSTVPVDRWSHCRAGGGGSQEKNEIARLCGGRPRPRVEKCAYRRPRRDSARGRRVSTTGTCEKCAKTRAARGDRPCLDYLRSGRVRPGQIILFLLSAAATHEGEAAESQQAEARGLRDVGVLHDAQRRVEPGDDVSVG